MDNPLTVLTTEQLRQRHSVKWRRYQPDVLPLWVAEMDVPLAGPIAAALAAAVDNGDTGYAHRGRLAEVFAAYASRHDWAPDPGRTVVLPDVVRAITEVLHLVTEPGDGVVINTPAYPPFFALIESTGRRIIESPLDRGADGRFWLDLERLGRDLARPDVTAYIVCNPHNPTGLVLRRSEVEAIAALAERHHVRLLSDEIHAPLTYPGATYTPLATLAGEAADASIIFVSASKAWNLAGLKASLAVAGGDAGWHVLARVPVEATFGTGLFGVIAAEAAYGSAESHEWLAALIEGLDHNRRLLGELLARWLPEVRYLAPEATYLAWLDFRGLGLGDDPAAMLLERGRVALSSGPDFGEPGRGHARLNLGTSPSRIEEAVRRMAAAIAQGGGKP